MKRYKDDFGTFNNFYNKTWFQAPTRLKNPRIFNFVRPDYKTPTIEQKIEFLTRKKIIEMLGGCISEYQYDKNPTFNKKDIINIKKYIRINFPKYKIVNTWNGIGFYCFRIGAEKR